MMHITIERLRYLVAVAQHGSFSAAARELGVSNTAVNKTIQALEFDLELEIFERHHGKRPTLTDAGKKLYVQALDILPKVLLMEQHAEVLSKGVEPSLTIAIHPYTLADHFNQDIKASSTPTQRWKLSSLMPNLLQVTTMTLISMSVLVVTKYPEE